MGGISVRSRTLILLLSVLLLIAAPLQAQERTRERQPPAPEQEEQQAPPEEEAQEPEETEPADDESTGEGEEAEEEAPPAPILSPEEQARIDELARKREERKAKREAKKAAEAEKQAEKQARIDAKFEEQLAKILETSYWHIDELRYQKAREGFERYKELEGGKSFQAEMGLARLELAMGNPALAIEHALRADKSTWDDAEEGEALTFAARAMLAARPLDPDTGKPLPGAELYEQNALRYYLSALAADPEGAAEAREELAAAFPMSSDEKSAKLYDRYLELKPNGPKLYGKRLAATYEALMSGTVDGHLVAVHGITPPKKLSGDRPVYPQEGPNARRRLVAEFEIEADGRVTMAKLLNGVETELNRAAEDVFKEWKFEPARLPSGEAVPVHFVVAVNAKEPPAGR